MAKTITTQDNIVGGIGKSDLSLLDNSDCANFLVEASETDRAVKKVLRSIPGTTTFIQGDKVRCLHKVNNVLYAAMGTKFGIISNNEFIPICNISQSGEVRMTHTGGLVPYILCVDGTSLFAVNTTLAPTEQPTHYKTITLPTGAVATDVAYLYGYIIMLSNSNDRMYWSYQWPFESTRTYGSFDEDDLFLLKATNDEGEQIAPDGLYFYAELTPDASVRMHEIHQGLCVVGTESMQFFTYTGENELAQPWATNDNVAVRKGGIASAAVDDTVYCYTNDGVWCFNGTSSQKVSSLDIDRLCSAHQIVDAWKCNIDKHSGVVFEFEDMTLFYDGNWVRLESLVAGNPAKWRYKYSATINNVTYLGHSAGIAYFDSTKYVEHDNNPIRRMRRGVIWERSGHTIQLDMLRILCNIGQNSRLTEDGVVHVTLCRNGGVGSIKEVKLPPAGQYKKVMNLYRCGIGKYWDITIECSDNAPLAIYGVETTFDSVIGEEV